MKKYIVHTQETRRLHMMVYADDPQDAIEKAQDGNVEDQWDGDYLGLNYPSEWTVEEVE